MLFLINDQVFDISDPSATADKLGSMLSSKPAALLSPTEVVEIGREVFFQAEADRPSYETLLTLSAMLADKTEANAALFIRPAQASARSDVIVRFVDAPLTTLVYLQRMQKGGAVPAAVVNDAVWRHAA